MDKKKILIILVLSIFVVGMVMGAASASHTFKKGKYKVTVSDKTYKQIKKGDKVVVKKVGTKKVKVQKYKTKKVTKYKWKYKNVVTFKTVYNSDFSDCTYHDYNYKHNQYVKNGWTYYGYKITKSANGRTVKTIDKFKKKVKVTETKKVKNGYKTVKKPLYMQIYSGWTGDLETGHSNGKIHVDLSTNKYVCF